MVFAAVLFGAAVAQGGAVPERPTDVQPLLVGSAVPAVELRGVDGEPTDLKAAMDGKPAVVIFYRGGWCPYCNVHLGKLKEIEPRLRELGYRILAVSPDRPEKLRESVNKQELSYELLSDSKMDAARAFGVAFRLDDATVKKYRDSYGIDIEADSGETHHQLPVPAAFVIGRDGRIHFVYANPDYKVRVDTDVLYAAARAAVREN